jgi:hypothetical protein
VQKYDGVKLVKEEPTSIDIDRDRGSNTQPSAQRGEHASYYTIDGVFALDIMNVFKPSKHNVLVQSRFHYHSIEM